jgi:hypothetical protein
VAWSVSADTQAGKSLFSCGRPGERAELNCLYGRNFTQNIAGVAQKSSL